MSFNERNGMQRYLVSLILAMCLKILPLPDYLSYLNPDWVLLILIYWTLVLPERIGVVNAWCVGLMIDVLTGRPLGQQALVYALVGYSSLKFHQNLRQYSLSQQSWFVFLNLLGVQLLIFWIESMHSTTEFTWIFWMPVVTGTLSWSLIVMVIPYIRIPGRTR